MKNIYKVTVKILSPHTVNLHIKDFEILRIENQLGFVIEGRPAGEGRLNIPWIIDNLKNNGRYPNIILELWTPFSESIQKTIRKEDDWAKTSIEYLMRILKNL